MKSIEQRKQELISNTKSLQTESMKLGILKWSMDRQLGVYLGTGSSGQVGPDLNKNDGDVREMLQRVATENLCKVLVAEY
jgi:hypothetical protein